LGRGKTRNKGIFKAENQLIVFLDSDREVEPDFLMHHLNAQENGPQVSIGRMLYHPDIPRTKINRYLEKRGAFTQPPDKNLPGRYFVSCNSSVPADILRKTGGFDENITHYGGEDLELGHRLAKLLPIRSLPEAVDYHNHFRKFEEFFNIVYGYGERSLPYIIGKHPELYGELGFENHPQKSPRDFLITFLCWKPIYLAVKMISKFDIVPDIFISYLIFRNYRAGYRHGIKDENQKY
jgi:GT2 family glycosyltransferase